MTKLPEAPKLPNRADLHQLPRKAATNAFAILLTVGISSLSIPMPAQNQPPQTRETPSTTVTIVVTDPTGAPIATATVQSMQPIPILRPSIKVAPADTPGHFTASCPSACTFQVQAPGFATARVAFEPKAGQPVGQFVGQPGNQPRDVTLTVTLQPASASESVTVTAYRTPLGDLESPTSTRLLSTEDIQQAPPITLDGQLRQIPGVETFRRSSSLVANPSSQGISLRGLGSTSASRTLVTEDDIPLNDAFAGWIHWEELPELSIHSVEVARGGASDLYGSSAIGGVLNILPQHATTTLAQLDSNYGSEDTYQENLLLQAHHGPETRSWSALAAGLLGTDGFIQTAPSQRGPIDTNSNVHAQNGVLLLERQIGRPIHPLRTFLHLSALNEARDNGTPVQKNGTRLWRYSTGADWNAPNSGTLAFRAYGSTQHYRQTFSTITSVAAKRDSEYLNRFARTPDDELGLVLHYSQPIFTSLFGPGLRNSLLVLAGADTHDVRALDQETTYKLGAVTSHINLSDRQRQTGAYAELLYTHSSWTASASGRFDWFSNFDGERILPASAPLPQFNQKVFDPRLGISRKLGQHFALSATAFRAFRAPTANELYRSTQVGSLLTLPNNNLRSERATGWETGAEMESRWGTIRTSYFFTEVNRPITALTTNPASNPIQLTRENLGQIQSRGLSLDFELKPAHWATLQGGYQYTDATVTKAIAPTTQFPLQTVFPGYWIPQVAHNMATLQLRGDKPKYGTLSLNGRISGHQFDDDANTYLLHSYFKLDAYASHQFLNRFELYTAAENLLNRAIEVGRTPTLTLANPRTARIGLNIKISPLK